MAKRHEDYANMVQRLYAGNDISANHAVCRNITFQITNACNLRCSYCYEHHKGTERMSIETGRKIVDYLLDLYEQNTSDFINRRTKAVVLDFIGGEPLLEAALIEKICDYWFAECFRRGVPLAPFTRISFATNGKLWFSQEAQHLFEKYHELMSVTISIDGIQELHDRYRIDADGNGSFSTAWAAFQDAKSKYGWLNSKMTFVPGSFRYIADSIKMMLDEGCTDIACNYAYEPVYTPADMLVKVMSYAKIRRGASTPFVIRSGSYMDDLVLFGRRWADIQSAARKLTKWALTELGLTIKNEWIRVDFLSAAEEHQRRHLTGAAKGCPGLDMAGYVMHRTYTTIRPRIFLRARRQYIRAKADVAQKGYVPVWRSYKLVSYNGYFDWTKSRAISETLKQKKLFTAAKVAIRVTAQRNAMKKVRIAA